MICQYCKKQFKTASYLTKHQKTAKFCCKIQNGVIENNINECNFCKKTFANKGNLNMHFSICKEKQKKDNINKIDELSNEINENKEYIEELKSKIQLYENNLLSRAPQPMFQNLNSNGILVLNDITIVSRIDGYINLSQLCKAGNKEYSNWLKNKNTEAYLEVLSSSLRIRRDELIFYETGSNQNRATWGHPQVAINIAQWISPEFNVQVSKWIFELMITGKVELGNEKSNKELENIYQEKINNLQNKLKNYETNVFQNNIDSCPIQYYGKDIVYFLKFDIPDDIKNKYISKYENINNENYSCIEFGVSSNFEERLKQHKFDKKKNNLIFLYAIEFNKRYLASKIEKYIKTIIKQMNINLDYEKKKECFIANEDEFNIIINKIKDGLNNIENTDIIEDDEEQINEYEDKQVIDVETLKYKYDIEKQIKIKKIEIDLEIEKERNSIEIKKIETITELFKNKLINLEEYKSMMKL
jgi:hypothetical protein